MKEFIDAYNELEKLELTDDGKGKLIDSIDDYEIWFVGSADASKQLGRFYKGNISKMVYMY